MAELVGGGSDINRATPFSFFVSVLLLASVERFGVSRMRNFFLSTVKQFYKHWAVNLTQDTRNTSPGQALLYRKT